jgi:hypothetical protein
MSSGPRLQRGPHGCKPPTVAVRSTLDSRTCVRNPVPVGTWHDPELGRPIAAPLERCAELLGVDLITIREAATNVESYLRADGTRIWSLMLLERQPGPTVSYSPVSPVRANRWPSWIDAEQQHHGGQAVHHNDGSHHVAEDRMGIGRPARRARSTVCQRHLASAAVTTLARMGVTPISCPAQMMAPAGRTRSAATPAATRASPVRSQARHVRSFASSACVSAGALRSPPPLPSGSCRVR